jgi:endonuclease/exonuclease/phosphatase family metal-dependent hydrolase
MSHFKKFLLFCRRSALWLSFVATLFLYILGFASAYLAPKFWWWLSILAFGFPLLMVALIVLIGILFWRKHKIAGYIGCFVLLLSLPLAKKVVAINVLASNKPIGVKFLSWNVARFGYGQNFNRNFPPNREEIVKTIGELKPDIMCLQEYWYIDSLHHKWNHLEFMKDSMHYPYYMFTNDYNWSASSTSLYGGNIIFSKYPITKTSKEKLFSIGKTEDIAIADIAINTDTFRFITYHLLSNRLSNAEVNTIEGKNNATTENKAKTTVGKNILTKLKNGVIGRAKQAEILHRVIEESPYPVICSGDFNDIPNSYSYRIASQGLNDAFLEKGLGWGRTYAGISPTLRIDYTWYSPSLKCNSFKTINYPQSDHYAMLSYFEKK